jgi:hypothetical protein
LILIAVTASGCSQAMRQPMPDMTGRLGLRVSQEEPSRMNEMPLGVHQVPDRPVYISGHQGAAGVGVLFGVIGVVAAHAAAQQTGQKKTESVEELLKSLDIRAATEKVFAEELERRRESPRFAAPGAASDATLEVIPYIVLTFIGDDRVRPWVVLKTSLKDGRGDAKWKTRYIAGLGETRTLGGDTGWASGDGEPLRSAVDRTLRTAVDILFRDASGEFPRGQGRAVKVQGDWVFVKHRLKVEAEILHETDAMLVITPKIFDATVFAGVNILDKKSVEVTAASE